MSRLLAFLGLRRKRHVVVPADPERLHRIYRETHRHVEDLRRAA